MCKHSDDDDDDDPNYQICHNHHSKIMVTICIMARIMMATVNVICDFGKDDAGDNSVQCASSDKTMLILTTQIKA